MQEIDFGIFYHSKSHNYSFRKNQLDTADTSKKLYKSSILLLKVQIDIIVTSGT